MTVPQVLSSDAAEAAASGRPGARAALGLVLVLAAAASIMPTAAGLVGYLVLASAAGAALLWANRPAALFEFALWLWVLAPGLRRVVDLQVGHTEDSLVLLAAPVASLACGALALRGRARIEQATARLVVRLLVLVLYAGTVSLLLSRAPASSGLAAVQMVAPLSLAMIVMLRLEKHQVAAALDRFSRGVLLLVGSYGILQFLVAPAWDAAWLRAVEDVATSFGRPHPLEIRVFSTLNDPGTLAFVLVFCLLWQLLKRRMDALGTVAVCLGSVCLALTLVRSAWLVLAVALVFAAVQRWLRMERVLVVAMGVVVLFSFFASALEPVAQRFTDTTTAGTTDESYQARVSFQAQQLLPALLDPVGEGLGSSGVAARRDARGDTRFADTDSGYLEVLRTFGSVLGGVLLWTTVAASVAGALSRDALTRGAAVFLAVIPVQLLFSSVLTGAIGAVFWCALAAATPSTLLANPSRGRRRGDVVTPGLAGVTHP